MECENATAHRPVILHAKYCWSSSPGTKKWPEMVLASPFNCVHLHFSGDSCVYGVLNDYPFYFCSKKKEIKSLLLIMAQCTCHDKSRMEVAWGLQWKFHNWNPGKMHVWRGRAERAPVPPTDEEYSAAEFVSAVRIWPYLLPNPVLLGAPQTECALGHRWMQGWISMLGSVSLNIPAQDPQSVKQVSSSSLSDVSQPCPREMQAAVGGAEHRRAAHFLCTSLSNFSGDSDNKGLLSIRWYGSL